MTTISIKGYKTAELKYKRNYNGTDVFEAETTKTRGKKRVTIFLHKKDNEVSIKSVCGLTQTTHESFELNN